MKKLIAVLAISAFSFTAAQAAELAEIDSDANGMISMEEAKAANITEEAFSSADADKDGSLNAEELASISE